MSGTAPLTDSQFDCFLAAIGALARLRCASIVDGSGGRNFRHEFWAPSTPESVCYEFDDRYEYWVIDAARTGGK